MKKEDWLWILGGLGIFFLMKNAAAQQQPAGATATASLQLPAQMVSTGVFGGTMVATGLAGVPKPSDRGRNVGTAHRSRYKYPAR